MKKDIKTILLYITIVALIFFVYSWHYAEKNKKEAQRMEQVRLVRNDSLRKVARGQYEKLVADTLTKKQLSEKIKELGIQLKNAELAQKIVFVPRDTITIIKEIKKTDSTLTFINFYPKKESYFVKHTTKVNTKDTTATGEFNFNPVTLSLGIAQQKNGTYKVVTKLPEYFTIKSLDVESLPTQREESNKWGILVGADYIQNLQTQKVDLGIDTYIRFKKFYIGGGITTNKDAKAGIKIEF